MPALHLAVRADGDSSTAPSLTPTMTNLLIALITLLFLSLVLTAALFVLRAHRTAKRQLHSHQPFSPTGSKPSTHRRLTITASPYGRRSESVYQVYSRGGTGSSHGGEKRSLIAGATSPPQSPIPEIRITFPEEEDDGSGKRKSGRVVVVRISETGGVGLEPYVDDDAYYDEDENLPPYQKSVGEGRFESLDLDRMGGLKELERGVRKS